MGKEKMKQPLIQVPRLVPGTLAKANSVLPLIADNQMVFRIKISKGIDIMRKRLSANFIYSARLMAKFQRATFKNLSSFILLRF
jgi:hypothetical protein